MSLKKERNVNLEEISRFRKPEGIWRAVSRFFLVGACAAGILYMLDVPTRLGFFFYREQYIGLFLSFMLAATFLITPARKTASWIKVPWYDILLAVVSLPVGLYHTFFWPVLVPYMGYVLIERVVLGSLAIILVLEGVRRVLGWPLVAVLALFLIYTLQSGSFPGPLGGISIPWPRLTNYLYLDTAGFLGLVGLVGTIGLAFFLFGQALFVFGGGKFFTDVAFALAGRFRGGPAKVAVIGSALFGTIYGAPVANVIVTGRFTIPMMKEVGYRPEMAGAVEAVSSTGGEIMPPVMGIAAFIIAETLGISYAEVALAALIPALLYYFAIFTQVDLEAAKHGLKGITSKNMPQLAEALKEGLPLLLPVGVLVYTLFIIRLTPSLAGLFSFFAAIAVMGSLKENRKAFGKNFLYLLEETGRMLVQITVILAAAGLLIGMVSLSGLGSNLSLFLVHVAGGNIILLLVLTAVMCYILGMGMPSPPAYVLVSVLAAPALVEMGILPLAAHLFVYYFAILSAFTPPVAVAAYTAAIIAHADLTKTGFTAMRLGVLAYIVPFVFVFSPSLILAGPPLQIVTVSASIALGTWVLGGVLVGYLFRELSVLKRLILALGAGGLLMQFGDVHWLFNIAGAFVVLPLLLTEWWKRKAERRVVPTTG